MSRKDDNINLEGVIYEPSAGSKNISQTNNTKNIQFTDRSKNIDSKKIKRKRPEKSDFTAIYIITILIGIVIFLVVIIIVFTFSTKNVKIETPAKNYTNMKNVQIGDTQSNEKGEMLKLVAVIDRVNQYVLSTDGDSIIKNKFGQSILLAEVKAGDIVEIEYMESGNTIVSLIMSSKAWETRLVRNSSINREEKMIQVGNNNYIYDDYLVVRKDDELASIASIKPIDYITLRGLGDKVLSIDINKGHGSIEVINKDAVKNGIIEVNTDIFMTLDEVENIEVSEGINKIVIKGENIEIFVDQITIEDGEKYILDLKDVQIKTGVVTVTINPESAIFYVDEVATNVDDPIILEFGSYLFKAQREGYLPYEATINISDPAVNLKIDLEEVLIKSKLILTTTPEFAEIYVDGAYMGLSPIEAYFEYGVHTVTAKKDKYEEFSVQLTLDSKEMPYNLTLKEVQPVIE
jgi:hypothetical protein